MEKPYNLKERLQALGKKQRSLLPELSERGLNFDPSRLSDAINGLRLNPKAREALEICDAVVANWERQARL